MKDRIRGMNRITGWRGVGSSASETVVECIKCGKAKESVGVCCDAPLYEPVVYFSCHASKGSGMRDVSNRVWMERFAFELKMKGRKAEAIVSGKYCAVYANDCVGYPELKK